MTDEDAAPDDRLLSLSIGRAQAQAFEHTPRKKEKIP